MSAAQSRTNNRNLSGTIRVPTKETIIRYLNCSVAHVSSVTGMMMIVMRPSSRTTLRLSRIALLVTLLNQFFAFIRVEVSWKLPNNDASLPTRTSGQWTNGTFTSNKACKPRMVHIEHGGMVPPATTSSNRTILFQEKDPPRYGMPQPLCDDPNDCIVPGTWQETNNMTCNPIHEIDLFDNLHIVGKGGKRLVFSMKEYDGSAQAALKMFNYRASRKEDFGPMTIELQRRDALVHEVMSSSPYIVEMYGYCGASAIYEFGDGGSLLENIASDGALIGKELLWTAHRIAASVADLHFFDDSGNPTIAHLDIHGKQWIKVKGEYQLTGFNLAKQLKISRKTNLTIPFRRYVVDNVSVISIKLLK